MKVVFAVIEYDPYTETDNVIKVFADKNKAILFCKERGRNTGHSLYIREAPFVE